jgi:hypothetical protein
MSEIETDKGAMNKIAVLVQRDSRGRVYFVMATGQIIKAANFVLRDDYMITEEVADYLMSIKVPVEKAVILEALEPDSEPVLPDLDSYPLPVVPAAPQGA